MFVNWITFQTDCPFHETLNHQIESTEIPWIQNLQFLPNYDFLLIHFLQYNQEEDLLTVHLVLMFLEFILNFKIRTLYSNTCSCIRFNCCNGFLLNNCLSHHNITHIFSRLILTFHRYLSCLPALICQAEPLGYCQGGCLGLEYPIYFVDCYFCVVSSYHLSLRAEESITYQVIGSSTGTADERKYMVKGWVSCAVWYTKRILLELVWVWVLTYK